MQFSLHMFQDSFYFYFKDCDNEYLKIINIWKYVTPYYRLPIYMFVKNKIHKKVFNQNNNRP